MKLTEYTTITLPRETVERAAEALRLIGISAGPLGELLQGLVRSLNRDHNREAVARIKDALGDLGPGDLLDAIADAAESVARRERGVAARRPHVADHDPGDDDRSNEQHGRAEVGEPTSPE